MTILTTVMVKAVVRSFLPKMSPTGRITNIGSNFGLVDRICGDEPFSSQLRQAFTDPELTEKELDRLVNSFTQDVKVGEIYELERQPRLSMYVNVHVRYNVNAL